MVKLIKIKFENIKLIKAVQLRISIFTLHVNDHRYYNFYLLL